VSATKTVSATAALRGLPRLAGNEEHLHQAYPRAEAVDREQLLDRLHQLRTIIPVFAQELAGVRRVADQLRTDNQRLLQEVRRLQAAHEEPSGAPSTLG
jgi:hypothetical protein